MRLWVQVHQDNLPAPLGQFSRQVHRRSGLTNTTLLIDKGNNSHKFPSQYFDAIAKSPKDTANTPKSSGQSTFDADVYLALWQKKILFFAVEDLTFFIFPA